jgi:ribosomal protein S20
MANAKIFKKRFAQQKKRNGENDQKSSKFTERKDF